jgi:hypothetical protein
LISRGATYSQTRQGIHKFIAQEKMGLEIDNKLSNSEIQQSELVVESSIVTRAQPIRPQPTRFGAPHHSRRPPMGSNPMPSAAEKINNTECILKLINNEPPTAALTDYLSSKDQKTKILLTVRNLNFLTMNCFPLNLSKTVSLYKKIPEKRAFNQLEKLNLLALNYINISKSYFEMKLQDERVKSILQEVYTEDPKKDERKENLRTVLQSCNLVDSIDIPIFYFDSRISGRVKAGDGQGKLPENDKWGPGSEYLEEGGIYRDLEEFRDFITQRVLQKLKKKYQERFVQIFRGQDDSNQNFPKRQEVIRLENPEKLGEIYGKFFSPDSRGKIMRTRKRRWIFKHKKTKDDEKSIIFLVLTEKDFIFKVRIKEYVPCRFRFTQEDQAPSMRLTPVL